MTRDIRLLSIVTRMNVGGPAVQISTLMRSFAGTRVYQVLLTGHVEPDEEDYLELNGSDLRFLRIRGLQRQISPTKDAEALARISHFIRGFQPDIIHTHTAKAGTLGRLAAITTRSKAKRVHTFHGHLLHGYFSRENTKRIVQVERRLARHSHRLIAVGKTVMTDLLQEGIGTEEQFRVVPPGLSLRPAPAPSDARLQLGIPLSAPTVSFVGRLTAIKRIDRLAEVIKTVSMRLPSTHFVIAGDGTEFHHLEKLGESIGARLHLLGWRADVERIFAASDLTILTSDNEGTPVSLIQAGLMGVPAVATDVGSVEDVVVNGSSGVLATTSSESIAKETISLLQNTAKRHQMSVFAESNYQKRFGAQALVEGHLRIYDELLRDT